MMSVPNANMTDSRLAITMDKESGMTKTVTATEAKNRLGALLKEISQSNETVLIENRGTTQAVLISEDVYRSFLVLEWEQRRAEAIRRLEEIEAEVGARGDELTEEEAMELAVQAVREVRAEKAIEQLKEDRQ
jgi:prevent-host-death family protein